MFFTGSGSQSESSIETNTDAPPMKLEWDFANQANLKKAWETTHKTTKDDWIDWIRRFSLCLLSESPSAALRACFPTAEVGLVLSSVCMHFLIAISRAMSN